MLSRAAPRAEQRAGCSIAEQWLAGGGRGCGSKRRLAVCERCRVEVSRGVNSNAHRPACLLLVPGDGSARSTKLRSRLSGNYLKRRSHRGRFCSPALRTACTQAIQPAPLTGGKSYSKPARSSNTGASTHLPVLPPGCTTSIQLPCSATACSTPQLLLLLDREVLLGHVVGLHDVVRRLLHHAALDQHLQQRQQRQWQQQPAPALVAAG